MSFLTKSFPGRHAVLILVTLILLSMAGAIDFILHDRVIWIDVVWLVPITFSAVFLSPVETIGTGLAASIFCLAGEAGENEGFWAWYAATVAATGFVAAGASHLIRHYLGRLNLVHEALESSPLAYAEFRFPGYGIASHNSAFRELSDLTVEPGPKDSLFTAFPEDSAALLARFMDESINNREETECREFHLPTRDGGNTFWSISFIPLAANGTSSPRVVAMFASEVTEAVTRSRTREAALRIGASAMSSLDLDETIRVAMDGLAYIAGANGGSLLLLEDDQWVGKVGYGTFNDEMVQKKLRFPYETLPAPVAAVENKEVICVPDVSKDSRFSPKLISHFHTKSCMVVPLVTGNRVVGAVHLVHTDEIRDFTEEQIKFATIVGSHAALAIENAMIYQNERSMRKSLEAIEVVSEAGLVSLDLEEVLIELVNRTQDVMQMDAAMILLYDREQDCLVGRAVTGSSATVAASQTRVPVGGGIAGQAYQEGTPLKIDDIRGNAKEVFPGAPEGSGSPFSEDQGMVSVLAVPLRVAGKVIGVLMIGSRRPAAFSSREWGLIQVLADRASQAVQNSLLHEETKKELSRAALLRDVASACADSQNVRDIARRALDAIYQQMKCKLASVYYLDSERQALINLAFIGHPEEVTEEYRVSPLSRGSLLTRAVNEHRIITHDEINLDNASKAEAQILKMLDIGYNRCARVPIVYQDEPVGAFTVAFADRRPFTPGTLETLASIANQLAVAFKNSDLEIENQEESLLKTADD